MSDRYATTLLPGFLLHNPLSKFLRLFRKVFIFHFPPGLTGTATFCIVTHPSGPPNPSQLLPAILIASECKYVPSKDSVSPRKPRHAHLGFEEGELPHRSTECPTRPQPFDHGVIGPPGSRSTTRFPPPHNHHHQKVLNHCPPAAQTGNDEYQMCNCGFGSWTQVENLRP